MAAFLSFFFSRKFRFFEGTKQISEMSATPATLTMDPLGIISQQISCFPISQRILIHCPDQMEVP